MVRVCACALRVRVLVHVRVRVRMRVRVRVRMRVRMLCGGVLLNVFWAGDFSAWTPHSSAAPSLPPDLGAPLLLPAPALLFRHPCAASLRVLRVVSKEQ